MSSLTFPPPEVFSLILHKPGNTDLGDGQGGDGDFKDAGVGCWRDIHTTHLGSEV